MAEPVMRGNGGWRRDGHVRHGAGRGGNARFFDYGELRHVVLALLDEQPRHGYDIIRAIDQRTGGAYCPSPGVIYPTLALLQDVGHVRAEAEHGSRNRYQITPDGRAFLVENRTIIDALLSRMRHVGAAQASASPTIIAAMDGLKSALRSGDEPWTAEEAKAVAAAIEAAAQRIRALRRKDEA
jgi:DNA-binding PadR family transcriptional regulator